jgi:hypothetical protein
MGAKTQLKAGAGPRRGATRLNPAIMGSTLVLFPMPARLADGLGLKELPYELHGSIRPQ